MSTTYVEGSGYRRVDSTTSPTAYVDRLDVVGDSPFWRSVKVRMLDAMRLTEGHVAVDIGCGAGNDVRAMSQLTGGCGIAIGVDVSATMVREAVARSEGHRLPVAWFQASAGALPLATGAIDGCRVERVLQHIAAPAKAVAEMARITRPGGRAVVAEPDYGSLSIQGGDPDLTRKIVAARCRHFASGRIGLMLPILMHSAGFREIETSILEHKSHELGFQDQATLLARYTDCAVDQEAITMAEGRRWMRTLESDAERGELSHSIKVYLVSAVSGQSI